MQATDITAFRALLTAIHLKAFGEPISKLSHSKAQMLSWLILEATGELLSYKSLSNYVAAMLEECPQRVNPNLTTLVILAEFATGQRRESQPLLAQWFRLRSQFLAAA